MALVAGAAAAAGAASWPRTSQHPVAPLEHPTLESRLAGQEPAAGAGFEFVAFGDQRALLGGDAQRLFGAIDTLARRHERLLFLVDTGDIVDDGAFSDQFRVLADLLASLRRLPYLVAAGNHEVSNNRRGPARGNTARFLSSIDEAISADRLYYRKIVGRVRFLFLDTNDLVYRPGKSSEREAIERRAASQLEWLTGELADQAFGPGATTIVVMHHPLVQSSAKHREQACDLWNSPHGDRRLADLFADGGVDLVLTGHTHTYERFTLTRHDGRRFHLVNLSGKPKPAFVWFGAGERRARDIRGQEVSWLSGQGWTGLAGWSVTQEEAMTEDEANQFGLFTVDADGGVALSTHFLGRPRTDPPVRLVAGVPGAATGSIPEPGRD